jgi:hypothetical protein
VRSATALPPVSVIPSCNQTLCIRGRLPGSGSLNPAAQNPCRDGVIFVAGFERFGALPPASTVVWNQGASGTQPSTPNETVPLRGSAPLPRIAVG